MGGRYISALPAPPATASPAIGGSETPPALLNWSDFGIGGDADRCGSEMFLAVCRRRRRGTRLEVFLRPGTFTLGSISVETTVIRPRAAPSSTTISTFIACDRVPRPRHAAFRDTGVERVLANELAVLNSDCAALVELAPVPQVALQLLVYEEVATALLGRRH